MCCENLFEKHNQELPQVDTIQMGTHNVYAFIRKQKVHWL